MKLNAVGVLYINTLTWTEQKLMLGVVSCSFWAAQCMANSHSNYKVCSISSTGTVSIYYLNFLICSQ